MRWTLTRGSKRQGRPTTGAGQWPDYFKPVVCGRETTGLVPTTQFSWHSSPFIGSHLQVGAVTGSGNPRSGRCDSRITLTCSSRLQNLLTILQRYSRNGFLPSGTSFAISSRVTIHGNSPAEDPFQPSSVPSWSSCLGLHTGRASNNTCFVPTAEQRHRSPTTFPFSHFRFSARTTVAKQTHDLSQQTLCWPASSNHSSFPQARLSAGNAMGQCRSNHSR